MLRASTMMIRSWVELDEAMLDIDHGTPGQHLVYILVRQLPLLTVSPEVREHVRATVGEVSKVLWMKRVMHFPFVGGDAKIWSIFGRLCWRVDPNTLPRVPRTHSSPMSR